jgi:REP element-mobilizing transposase RayT
MPYFQLLYHLIWSTKDRESLLSEKVEPIIHNFLRSKAIGLGAIVYALNGTEDHVHAVVSIPPKLSVARFVGQVKAVASTKFNKSFPHGQTFFWQNEYGAFSLDGKRLPNFIAYVERQKEHHTQGNIIPVLERTSGSSPTLLRDSGTGYVVEDEQWWQEMETTG